MNKTTSLAIGGSYAFTLLMKPYEKALASWAPPPWVLNFASVLAMIVAAVCIIHQFIKTKS